MLTLKSSAFIKIVEDNIPNSQTFIIGDEIKNQLDISGFDLVPWSDNNLIKIQKRDNAKGFFAFELAENGDFVVHVNFNLYDIGRQAYLSDFTNCSHIGGSEHWVSRWKGRGYMGSMYGREAHEYMEQLHSAIMEALGSSLHIELRLPFVVLKEKSFWINDCGKSRSEECACVFTRSELEQLLG